MDIPLTERRGEPRLPAAALQIDRATLRPGCPVDLVDLSANGAQVQSARPLRPGSRIHVRLSSRNRTLAVAALVVRCSVWTLDAEAITYRGALRFEEECRSFWEEQARIGYALLLAPP
jgi:PilZ domain